MVTQWLGDRVIIDRFQKPCRIYYAPGRRHRIIDLFVQTSADTDRLRREFARGVPPTRSGESVTCSPLRFAQ